MQLQVSVLKTGAPGFPTSGACVAHFNSCADCQNAGGILSHHPPYVAAGSRDANGNELTPWPPVVD